METLKVNNTKVKKAVSLIKEGIGIFVDVGQHNPLQPGFIKEVVFLKNSIFINSFGIPPYNTLNDISSYKLLIDNQLYF